MEKQNMFGEVTERIKFNPEQLEALNPGAFFCDIEELNKKKLKQNSIETDYLIKQLTTKYEQMIGMSGIKVSVALEEVKNPSNTLSISVIKLRFEIYDPERLADFIEAQCAVILRKLKDEQPGVHLDEIEGRTKALSSIISRARTDLDKATEITGDDNYLISLAGHAPKIFGATRELHEYCSDNYEKQLSKFNTLGVTELEDAIEQFKPYVLHIKNGDLKEFLSAKELLLDEPFMPNITGVIFNWHRYNDPQEVESQWDKVIDVIMKIRENKNSTELYAQALETARKAVDFAMENVKSWADKNAKNKNKLITILTKAKYTLSEM